MECTAFFNGAALLPNDTKVQMQTKQLGNSDMKITAVGVGAWAIGGGGWAFGWGPQDDNESVEGIRAAIDAGMNWIDTAAVYGLGHSEEVVARALDGMAKKPYVFTKCERTWNSDRQIIKCLKADSIKREFIFLKLHFIRGKDIRFFLC